VQAELKVVHIRYIPQFVRVTLGKSSVLATRFEGSEYYISKAQNLLLATNKVCIADKIESSTYSIYPSVRSRRITAGKSSVLATRFEGSKYYISKAQNPFLATNKACITGKSNMGGKIIFYSRSVILQQFSTQFMELLSYHIGSRIAVKIAKNRINP
jgi:hypothetical protein